MSPRHVVAVARNGRSEHHGTPRGASILPTGADLPRRLVRARRGGRAERHRSRDHLRIRRRRSWSGCGRWDGCFPPSSGASTCSSTRRASSRRCSPPGTRLRRWSPRRGGSSMTQKRKGEATRWFQQAEHDLRAARWNVQGGFHDTACFLSHQAGEKALKSLLYYVGARRAALLTHSLVEMITHAAKQVPGLKELIEDARELDLHYIPSRYPNGLPSGYPHAFYGRATADKAVEAGERILDAVAGHYRGAGEHDILEPPDEQ